MTGLANEVVEPSLLGKLYRSHLTAADSLFPSMVRHKDCSQEKDVKTCPRDSGYDSLSSRLSILDRLLHTHSIWLQLNLSEEEAAEVLQSQPPGVRLTTSRKQVEAGSAAASLKTKRLGVLESSLQPVGNTVPDVYLGYSAGKFRRQLPEPFTICLSLSVCSVAPRKCRTQQDSRAPQS